MLFGLSGPATRMHPVQHALYRIREWYSVSGRALIRRIFQAIGADKWLSPNVVTMGGTLLNLVAAVLLVYGDGAFLLAGIVFIVGSLLDAVDGAIAKLQDRVTRFGGFLDSTMDRVSEGLILTGLGVHYASEENLAAVTACFVALAGSYLVSYTRARAEAAGATAAVGFASRVERVVLLAAGMVFAQWWPVTLEAAVYVVAATSSLTVLQRMLHVRRELRED